MSVVSEIFDTSSSQQDVNALSADATARLTQYYSYLKANYPAQYELEKQNDPAYQQQLRDEAAAAQTQSQITAAQGTNTGMTTQVAPPPGYSGPSAYEELAAVLPSGFEQGLLPSNFSSPFVESSLGAGKTSAQSFIENMLKRGTLTESGKVGATSALGTQEPNVRRRLTDIGNVLIENERAKLRGIAGEGYQAAQGQTGEFFDPSSYQQRVQSELGQFQQAFPQSYTSSVGDVGGLFNVAGLPSAGGGVTRPQNVSFDPYAVEGGKLSTGLGDTESAPTGKKRTTAVF